MKNYGKIVLVTVLILVGFVFIKCNQAQNTINTAFPDDNPEWTYHSVKLNSKGITINASPANNDLGYSNFKFVLSLNLFSVEIVECSVFDSSGNWALLFTQLTQH